ncbi:unnamed protein product [Symbiodinium sp. CCMP2592]|nr:unnamed protein product [Symbiodinium sp. CCMP2592]CAE7366953.1 unnamed protein product [Symbiodinium sp. CCMP2592]CAE7429702.1 unnamed protein product [Symbiodinium sp. CCMP2592]CAE7492743.1 unnamed protein product [Symbiodinium sp. CCMP2592]CAE7643440.1 unnamed protein product [Symbiodinium sp. CCMP2592]
MVKLNKAGGGGEGESQSIINLDDFLAGLTAASLAENKVLQSIPAVAAMIADFASAVESVSQLLRWVFLREPAFSQVASKQEHVSPEALQVWADAAESRLSSLVEDPQVLLRVQTKLVSPVKLELARLYSAGLDSVAPIVDQLTGNMLGAGLTKGLYEDLMIKIPSNHKLAKLVDAFAKVAMFPSKVSEKDQVRSFIQSLKTLSEELARVISQGPEIEAADLLRTKIADPTTRNFLHQQVSALHQRLTTVSSNFVKDAWAKHGEVASILDDLPSPDAKKEETYRTAMLQHCGTLAQKSASVGAILETLQSFKAELEILSKIQFVDGLQSGLESQVSYEPAGSADVFAEQCNRSVTLSKLHVALIAAICLMRNPSLTKRTEEGKTLMAKLKEVHPTLVKHIQDWKPYATVSTPGFRVRAYAETLAAEVLAVISPQDPAKTTDSKRKKKGKADEDDDDEERTKAKSAKNSDAKAKEKKDKSDKKDKKDKKDTTPEEPTEKAKKAVKDKDKDKSDKKPRVLD